MAEEFFVARIVLMVISFGVIVGIIKLKIDDRVGNQFLTILIIFWSSVFLISFSPTILDELIEATGLINRAQFLLIISIIVILYILALQISKNRRLSLDFNRIISEIAISNVKQKIKFKDSEIAIIIPAYNEVESLLTVLHEIPEKILDHKISKLVIDDGSFDDTYKVAINNNAYCLRHETNLGQGSAIITGINFLLPFSPKAIVTFDADGQHNIRDMERLIKPIILGECDMTVGSRFMGNQEYVNTERLVGIHFFTKLINFLCKSNISDCTNGFRVFNPKIFSKIQFKEKRYSAPEIIMKVSLNGFKLKNVPVILKQRTAGKTKKPRLGFALGILRVIVTTWLHHKI